MWFFKKLFKRKQRKKQQQLQHHEQQQTAPAAIPRIPSIPQLPRLELDLAHADQDPIAQDPIDKQVSIKEPVPKPEPILPPEIWVLIFSNLAKEDIPQVLQTCRLFQTHAEPLLYRTIKIVEGSYAMEEYSSKIDRLNKKFTNRPDLGYHVRVFVFVSSERTDLKQAYDEITGGDRDGDPSHESPDDVQMARVLWQSPKSTECLEVRVMKLLLHCPHVQELRISTALLPLMELYDINQLMTSGSPISSQLSRLRDVHVLPPFWDQGLPLKQELEDSQKIKLICLPGLPKFKGMVPPPLMERVLENRRQATVAVAQEGLLLPPPPLERLVDFTCVTTLAEKMDEFLHSIPNLHTFRYLHTYTPTGQTFYCKQLYENLQPVNSSLKRLTIKHEESPTAHHGRKGPCIGHFGSLRHFTNLTYLNIPWMLLTKRNSALSNNGTKEESIGNILPPNLEMLKLNIFLVYTGENKGAILKRRDALLTEFVQNWRTYTPRLRGIDYNSKGKDWWTSEFFSKLGTLCHEGGLFNQGDYEAWRIDDLRRRW